MSRPAEEWEEWWDFAERGYKGCLLPQLDDEPEDTDEDAEDD